MTIRKVEDAGGLTASVLTNPSWDGHIRFFQATDSRSDTNGFTGAQARALGDAFYAAAQEVDPQPARDMAGAMRQRLAQGFLDLARLYRFEEQAFEAWHDQAVANAAKAYHRLIHLAANIVEKQDDWLEKLNPVMGEEIDVYLELTSEKLPDSDYFHWLNRCHGYFQALIFVSEAKPKPIEPEAETKTWTADEFLVALIDSRTMAMSFAHRQCAKDLSVAWGIPIDGVHERASEAIDRLGGDGTLEPRLRETFYAWCSDDGVEHYDTTAQMMTRVENWKGAVEQERDDGSLSEPARLDWGYLVCVGTHTVEPKDA